MDLHFTPYVPCSVIKDFFFFSIYLHYNTKYHILIFILILLMFEIIDLVSDKKSKVARSIKREILKVRRQLAMQQGNQSATEMDDVHSLDTTGK